MQFIFNSVEDLKDFISSTNLFNNDTTFKKRENLQQNAELKAPAALIVENVKITPALQKHVNKAMEFIQKGKIFTRQDVGLVGKGSYFHNLFECWAQAQGVERRYNSDKDKRGSRIVYVPKGYKLNKIPLIEQKAQPSKEYKKPSCNEKLQHPKIMDTKDAKAIYSLYKDGATITSLAELTGFKYSTLFEFLRRNNVSANERRSKRMWTEREIKQLKNLVKSGKPIDEIARQLNRSLSAVKTRLSLS